MKVLAFLFFLLLSLYIFGIVVKLLFRLWITRKVRQFEQDQKNNTSRAYTWSVGNRNARPRQKPEGAVTVEQTAPKQKQVSKSVGDYVEFEEVEVTEEEE